MHLRPWLLRSRVWRFDGICEMPVYHFTIHAYRSWRPDNPRGYAEKGKGYHPPDPEVAARYDRAATQDQVVFRPDIQRDLLRFAHSICEDERWRLEGAGHHDSHAHYVVSWKSDLDWREVDRKLKNLLSFRMNKARNSPGKRWFVRRHSAPRRVRNQEHIDHLLTQYLPAHPGLFWRRGLPLPDRKRSCAETK